MPLIAVSFALALDNCRWRRGVIVVSAVLTVLATFMMLAYWQAHLPISDSTGAQFRSALRGEYLPLSQMYLIFVAAAALTAYCLAESTSQKAKGPAGMPARR
jgi:hypothetical protein